jgi:hypothetical protein
MKGFHLDALRYDLRYENTCLNPIHSRSRMLLASSLVTFVRASSAYLQISPDRWVQDIFCDRVKNLVGHPLCQSQVVRLLHIK